MKFLIFNSYSKGEINVFLIKNPYKNTKYYDKYNKFLLLMGINSSKI